MSKTNTNGSVNGAIVKSRKGVEPKAARVGDDELMAAVALESYERRKTAIDKLTNDARSRLNRAIHLAFTAWSIAEHGGRASVYLGWGDEASLDIHVNEVLDIGGDGQSLRVTGEV